MKNTPYINYIRSFEAAARHLSFTAAADELNYTQAAISNHVRSLEDFVGRPLFIRNPRSLTLTTLGTAYLPSVQKILNELDEVTEGIATSINEKLVTVSCPISLAQNWIANVVPRFNEVHPDITVAIHGNIWSSEEDTEADIRISYLRDEEIPETGEVLWREDLCVVCSPDYMVNGKRPEKPSDLKDAHLIHILGRTAFWRQFRETYQLEDWDLTSRTQTNSLNVALELAANGLGCALVPRSLSKSFLKRGLLVIPFKQHIPSPWVCYMRNNVTRNAQITDLLANWLRSEADAP